MPPFVQPTSYKFHPDFVNQSDISAAHIFQPGLTNPLNDPMALQNNINHRPLSFHNTNKCVSDSIFELPSVPGNFHLMNNNINMTFGPNGYPIACPTPQNMVEPIQRQTTNYVGTLVQPPINNFNSLKYPQNFPNFGKKPFSDTMINGLWDFSPQNDLLIPSTDSQLVHPHVMYGNNIPNHYQMPGRNLSVQFQHRPNISSTSSSKGSSPLSSTSANSFSGGSFVANGFASQPYSSRENCVFHPYFLQNPHLFMDGLTPVTLNDHPSSFPKNECFLRLDPAIDAYYCYDRLERNSGYVLSNMSFEPPHTREALSSLVHTTYHRLYLVAFKGARVDVFTIPDKSTFEVEYGDLVIVDADRGRDLGKVIKKNLSAEDAGWIKWKKFNDQQAVLQHPFSDTESLSQGSDKNEAKDNASKHFFEFMSPVVPKSILRHARSDEIQQILTKEVDEEKALKTCFSKVSEKALNMYVVDAEYQWDRAKLTFFYCAEQRIDFRDLVRDLFRIYKTRIWMCATNSVRIQSDNLNKDFGDPETDEAFDNMKSGIFTEKLNEGYNLLERDVAGDSILNALSEGNDVSNPLGLEILSGRDEALDPEKKESGELEPKNGFQKPQESKFPNCAETNGIAKFDQSTLFSFDASFLSEYIENEEGSSDDKITNVYNDLKATFMVTTRKATDEGFETTERMCDQLKKEFGDLI